MITIILLLPLLGAIITGLFTKSLGRATSQIITILLMVIACSFAIDTAINVINTGQIEKTIILEWINVANFSINWTCTIDSLTAIMIVVVTIVSTLVHIYSIGYMHHDNYVQRFMSYLSLFTFFMLILVTSDNLLQLFCGWEGVGLCSYLLIGFWYHKESANNAAMKAFIVNRIADVAFAVGLVTLFMTFDTIEFSEIFENIDKYIDQTLFIAGYELNILNFIGVLLFIGAMGKSAQIGLHVWLPDAMEGPTPVSALIHAATMVTAGVFLVARFSPLYEYANAARDMIAYIGAITAFFAGTIAIAQNDIKKIIAYSTCSQLGYMFFACGVGAYNAAIFHLATHAFFKALLFLSAGSVIHAIGDEQDIRKMGGLYKKIPFTYVMMWIGSLALSGIYPFAGYYSKDTIIESAFAYSGTTGMFAYWSGVITAFLTAFYSWRLLLKVFHGNTKMKRENYNSVHESGFSMLLPLFCLSLGAIFGGIIGVKLGFISPDMKFWHGTIATISTSNIMQKIEHIDELYKEIPLFAAFSGIVLAYICYILLPKISEFITIYTKPIYQLFLNKYYFDQIYDCILVKNIRRLSSISGTIIDKNIIDNYGPNGASALSKKLSNAICSLQTGYIYHYALAMMIGVILIITWYIVGGL